MPSLVIDRNYVIVEHVRIARPARISVSTWLSYWERFQVSP